MIGEIRDDETAQIAAQAALTGHFVLSTLHTNNAIGSVQRLLNVGVSPDNLAELANGFMAQRLIRVLCECKKEKSPTQEEKKRLEDVLKTISPNAGVIIPSLEKIYEPVGCPKCRGIGYRGRSVISEVLTIEGSIQELIAKRALSSEIEKKAIEEGMITMQQDGALKVAEGITSLAEVARVTEF
jgi:type II secretory ATPase GspE/PulE/Tfp pilus assembly ATPase PilB-like protein